MSKRSQAMKDMIERFNTMSPNSKILYVDRWESTSHIAGEQFQPIVMDEVAPLEEADWQQIINRQRQAAMEALKVKRDNLGELKDKL